jgi:HK97 family phage prohead protease
MIREWARAVGSWLGVRFSGEEPSVDRVVTTFMRGLATVDRRRALSVPAIKRGRDMICSIATLPLVERDASNVQQDSELLTQIDPNVANVVTLAQVLEDLLFDAISWWVVVERDPLGFPVKARHVDVTSVSLQPPPGYNPAPLPSGEDPRGAAVWVDGVRTDIRNVIRFDSPNPGLLHVGADVVRRAVAIDAAARLYADNPVPLDYFTPDADADPAPDGAVETLLGDWARARRTRTTAYVPVALKYNTVDVISPRDLQLVELQRQAALDLAIMVGLDPEDVGVSTTSRTYQNASDRRLDRVTDTFSPYIRAITDRLSMGDVTQPGRRVDFDLTAYLRADHKTRAEFYAAGLEGLWLDAEDVQRLEGIPVKKIAPPPAPAPAALPDNVRELRPRLAASGGADPYPYGDPAAYGLVTFDAEVQAVVFAGSPAVGVDLEARTISGIVMPYGRTSTVIKHGRRWQFAPGALKFAAADRVKLLEDHDFSRGRGYMIEAEERPEGMWARYKVGRGPEGDKVLARAADKVADAFSCGVVIRAYVKHPTEAGTYIVTDAHWQETSVLTVPAFDDARLAADGTSQGETMHTCSTCNAELVPGVAHTCATPAGLPTVVVPPPATAPVPAAQFDAAQFGAFAAAFAAWQSQNGNVAVGPPQPVAPGPTLVDPRRGPVQVVEPEPYRFGAAPDGGQTLLKGSHEFSTDAFAFFNGDKAAGDRIGAFLATAFDVVTSNVNELSPTLNRPGMYVDQRDYKYPLWNRTNKGTLTDVTPFTFPKFSSASGLVGNHTEGTEPSSGTFVTTSDTVTPTPVSGKMKISRETIDQGGNPQVTALIWRQMTKAYYEALEAYVVALLDAASPTAIALTAGGGTTGQTLYSELRKAIARLQFIRGGFTFTDAFAQIDLYLAMVDARDNDGRPLFPSINPANAAGTSGPRLASLDMDGVPFHPEWALAATGSVVASSYLIDPDSVWAWASNPRELRFEYEVANLYMGLWGYKAAVITDLTGVREITYDPVP